MKVRGSPLSKMNSHKDGLVPISNLETVQRREEISLVHNQLKKKTLSQLNATIWNRKVVQLVQQQNLSVVPNSYLLPVKKQL